MVKILPGFLPKKNLGKNFKIPNSDFTRSVATIDIFFYFVWAEESTAGNNPPTFFVNGCVGAANVCNGFYKINKELVNEKPQYNGPKLEMEGAKTRLWFSEKLNQWVFTKSSEVNSDSEEINIFAYVDSQADEPLEMEPGVTLYNLIFFYLSQCVLLGLK